MNKSRIAVVAAATLMGAALLSGGAFAKGPGSGGGGGGGPPTSPGASGKGDLYGDQWVIYRNEDGVPIVDDNGCVRPILYAPDYVKETCLIKLVGDTDPDAGNPSSGYSDDNALPLCTVPASSDVTTRAAFAVAAAEEEEEEVAVCDVVPEQLTLVKEAELSRLNVSRAMAKVIDQQLNDVTTTLKAAGNDIRLDEAGRLVANGDTIDSPLQNLAIFRELMKPAGGNFVIVDLPEALASNLSWPTTGLNSSRLRPSELHRTRRRKLRWTASLTPCWRSTFLGRYRGRSGGTTSRWWMRQPPTMTSGA